MAALLAAGTALLVAAWAGPSGANAKPTVRSGHIAGIVPTRGAQPAVTPNGAPPLLYHGGKVMQKQSVTYAIFWEPPTLQNGNPTSVTSTYNSLISRYFTDVGGNGLYNINKQYYQIVSGVKKFIVNKSTFGGSYVDTSAYPASGCNDSATPGACLTDKQLRSEVTKAMGVQGWTAAVTHQFFVFTSKGEGSCSQSSCAFTQFCAYHGKFTSAGKQVIYANMPYAGTNLGACSTLSSNAQSPNNDVDADSTINVTSHEHMEAVTDPLLNAWYDVIGYENGDECAWLFPNPLPLDGGKATVQWNGNYYYVQPEWSNSANDCLFSG